MSYQPDPYAAQDVCAQQQQLANENPYAARPSAYPPPQQPYGAPAYAQAGAMNVSNPWAKRALHSGVVSPRMTRSQR
jgi:hypothetical protein